MADFDKALWKTLRWEGGYVNDPDDPGGATNHGITLATYNYYFDDGLEGLKNISEERVRLIYYYGYWKPIKGDEIKDQSVAELLFDMAVNHGKSMAVKKIQKLLGCGVDGVVGPITLKAINDKPGKLLFAELHDVRTAYYKAIVARNPVMKKYLKGWLNRNNSFTYDRQA